MQVENQKNVLWLPRQSGAVDIAAGKTKQPDVRKRMPQIVWEHLKKFGNKTETKSKIMKKMLYKNDLIF